MPDPSERRPQSQEASRSRAPRRSRGPVRKQRIAAGAAPFEYDDRSLFVAVAVRVVEQRALDAGRANVAGRAENFRFVQAVRVDAGALDAAVPLKVPRESIGIARSKDDGTLVRGHRPRVAIEGRNRFAHQLIKDAAAPEETTGQVDESCVNCSWISDPIDNQLHGLGLAELRHRPRITR